MSYERYIRSNNPIEYKSFRVLNNDGILPENTEIGIEIFEDSSSKYKYNYSLNLNEFFYFHNNQVEEQQIKKMTEQIINLIQSNWKIKSEIILELIWEGKWSSPAKKYKQEVDYRLLNKSMIENLFILDLVDYASLIICSPSK